MAKRAPTSSALERTAMKRRKAEDDDSPDSQAKRPRTRVRYDPLSSGTSPSSAPRQLLVRRMPSAQAKGSSSFIYTRSANMLISFSQCDRQIPCSHVRSLARLQHNNVTEASLQCIARKVPELCKAYTPGKPDQDLSVRLARLEHIIELALPQYFHSSASPSAMPSDGHNCATSEGPDEDNRSITDEQDPSGGTFQSGKWYGNSASGSVAPASVLEQVNVSMACFIIELTCIS